MNSSMAFRCRNVYYFSGFDPRGTSYYSRLFHRESRKASFLNIDTAQKRLFGSSNLSIMWKANSNHLEADGVVAEPAQLHVNHFFMNWDDIIRAHWKHASWTSAIEYLQTYIYGMRRIPMRRIWRIDNGAFWAGILPGIFAIVTIASAVMAGLLAYYFSEIILSAESTVHWPLRMIFVMLAVLLIAELAGRIAQKTGVQWLAQIFSFNLKVGSQRLQTLKDRQYEWTKAIVQLQKNHPSNEVVIIGHSVGTIVMMEVVRLLMRDPSWQALHGTMPTRLLTLGHCLPFVSLNPEATEFRAAIDELIQNEKILWWDITAKADPLCFFQTPPRESVPSAPSPSENPAKPVLLKARFFKMYSRERWQRLRRNKLKLHFLYLMNPDIDNGFNLYRAIHTPRPLESQMSHLPHA
jgi:hypothetical protein